jgi:hypothetical protein
LPYIDSSSALVGATLVAAKELRTKTVIVANLRMFMPGRIQATPVPDDKPILPFYPRKRAFFPERHKKRVGRRH